MSLGKKLVETGHKYGVRPLDRRVGSVAIGNPNGVLPSMFGRLNIELSQAQSGYRQSRGENPEVTSAVSQLHSNGYYRLGQIYHESLIEDLQSKFDEVISQDELLNDSRSVDGEEYVRRMDGEILRYVPELAQLITPQVRRLVNEYYGSYFQVRECYGYRNFHVPEEVSEDVYADHWHIDPHTTDHLKLFVNLSDVTEDHGPLHIIPRADTARIARKKINWDRQTDGLPNRVVEPEAHVERLTGPAGTAMLGNTYQTFHRAGVPAEGNTRDFFQFIFAPASEPLADDWEEQELEGVTDQHVRRPLRY